MWQELERVDALGFEREVFYGGKLVKDREKKCMKQIPPERPNWAE
jgi:endonuclease IV